MQTLFATLQNDPLLPLVKITAIYGLRRSELLGLQWDSIDEERGTLAICHTVVKVTSVVEKDKTKNRTSRRAFPLTPEASAIFAEAKRKEIENRRLFGADYIRTLALVWVPAALDSRRRARMRPQRRRVETRPPIFFLTVFHKFLPKRRKAGTSKIPASCEYYIVCSNVNPCSCSGCGKCSAICSCTLIKSVRRL